MAPKGATGTTRTTGTTGTMGAMGAMGTMRGITRAKLGVHSFLATPQN